MTKLVDSVAQGSLEIRKRLYETSKGPQNEEHQSEALIEGKLFRRNMKDGMLSNLARDGLGGEFNLYK